MYRYCIYILLFMTAISQGFGQSTLDDYLEIAVQNNPGLKSKYTEFEVALQKIPQVSSLDDPTFSITTFGQMVETRTGRQMERFSLQQMFPWFGTLTARKDAAALLAESNFEAFKNARNELLLQVKNAYYPLYEVEQAIRINEENIKILETFKTIAVAKFQNGKGKLSDALRVDIMTNDIQTEISILEEQRKPLLTAFNTILNRDDQTPVVIDNTLAIINPNISRDSLANNPQVEELRKKILAAQALERAAVKQSMPKIGVGVEYIVIAKRPEVSFADNGKDAYMAMFSVSLPIYRKKYKSAIKESQLMQTSYSQMQEQVENTLIAEYEVANFNLTRNKQQLALYQKQIGQTSQIITLLLASYENDKTDFEEILQMQQLLLKYQMLEITATKEHYLAIAKLDYLTAK